jgi:hypothetical protein
MRSSITLGFLNNGIPVTPNRQVNITDTHPGFEEGFRVLGVEGIISLVVATYEAFEGNFKLAGTTLLPIIKTAYQGKNELVAATTHQTFPEGGSLILAGKRTTVDELRVVFRAESEDTLTKSFGVMEQADSTSASGIFDEGEKAVFTQGGNNVYVHRFKVPLDRIAPGDYLFTFGSGDNGWLYNVGVVSVLTLTVARVGLRLDGG